MIRCPECDKLLAEALLGRLYIRCPRCKAGILYEDDGKRPVVIKLDIPKVAV